MSAREVHNSMVIPPEYWGLKEARDKEKNNIISDYYIRNILKTKLKIIPKCYKVMCRCECCIYAKSTHSYLLIWNDHNLKILNTKFKMRKTEVMVK